MGKPLPSNLDPIHDIHFLYKCAVPLDAAHTYFSDTAKDWYFQLAPAVQNSLSELKSAILARFKPQVPFSLGLVDITQKNTESVDQYISRIRKLSTDSIMPDDCLTTMIMKWLETSIRNIVMPQFPQTIDDLRTKSSIAEITVLMNKASQLKHQTIVLLTPCLLCVTSPTSYSKP